jgi:hypothetical protein
MHRLASYVASSTFLALLLFCHANGAQQRQDEHPSSQQPLNSGTVSLTISFRLENDSPFTDQVNVRLMTPLGFEIGGSSKGPQGEFVFPSVWPGNYVVEAGAPGFLLVRQSFEVKTGQNQQSLALIMKPEPANNSTPSTNAQPALSPNSWLPPNVDDFVPAVEPGTACSLSKVLQGAGERMEQFVGDLDKFSAAERLEHYEVNAKGQRRGPEIRSFDYVVSLSTNSNGSFELDESRNGESSNALFPAGIATEGVPGLALIFHPQMVSDFKFVCEGLGKRESRPAWQIRFEQKPDKPARICAYVRGGVHYPVSLRGRAWIDAETYQVLRIESELAKPIAEIQLTQERLLIDYASVRFHAQDQQLWLPKDADFYVEIHGRRFYRRHTFSKFKLFSVGVEQRVQAPKESYCFTNVSNRDVTGTLTVTPASGLSVLSVSLSFTVPAGQRTCKTVGPGKDVNISAETLGRATFVHDGPQDSVVADAHLINESTLEVISNSFAPAAR